MAALEYYTYSYFGTWNWIPGTYYPSPLPCNKELYEALEKELKREAKVLRDRAAIGCIARMQGVEAKHELRMRRAFLRIAGKRQTQAQRSRRRGVH